MLSLAAIKAQDLTYLFTCRTVAPTLHCLFSLLCKTHIFPWVSPNTAPQASPHSTLEAWEHHLTVVPISF